MKKVIKFLPLVAAVLGLIAVISLFLPAFVVAGNDFPGLAAVIGHTKKVATMSFRLLDFSFMNLVTYLLTLGGIVCAVLAYVKNKKTVFAWIAIGCFAIAGILFFLVMSLAVVGNGWMAVFGPYTLANAGKLGYGAILAGVSCLVAAVAVLLNKLLNK